MEGVVLNYTLKPRIGFKTQWVQKQKMLVNSEEKVPDQFFLESLVGMFFAI